MASGSDNSHAPLRAAGRLVSIADDKTYLVGTIPLTIGRGPESDVPVHNKDVSRNHAYLLRTPQGFLLVDSSLHGTFVNGQRMQAQRLLSDGDLIEVGDRCFRFDLRTSDSVSARPDPAPGELPETSQHPRTIPRDSRATGKVALALTLGGGKVVESKDRNLDQAVWAK